MAMPKKTKFKPSKENKKNAQLKRKKRASAKGALHGERAIKKKRG